VVGDVTFRLPALQFADALSRGGGKAFVYQFDHTSPERRLGACHCIDLPFIFGTYGRWNSAPILAGADAEDCAAVSATAIRMVAGFANGGTPGIAHWDPDERRLTHIDRICREAPA
jgi:para-nitrobenzyl esterase